MIEFSIHLIKGFSLCAGFEYVDDVDIAWYAALDLGIIRFAFIGYQE